MNFCLQTKPFLCALCLLTSPLDESAQIPTDGLVAYYPFNGNADDESGNKNHGTVYGAQLTTDRFGIPNKAYSFNGSSDFIKVANGAAFNFDKTNAFTLNVWINPHHTQLDYAGILDKSHAHILNGNTLKGFILQKALSSFSFYSYDTMGERIRRIGQIQTDFFLFFTDFKHTYPKKSVSIRPIRPIRSPIVS
jgi:hypothetical protein